MISQVTGIFDQPCTISLPFHPLLLDDPNLFFQHDAYAQILDPLKHCMHWESD